MTSPLADWSPIPLTILADVTAGPRFVVIVPRAVIPEIQGLLPREGPPGLGWTEKETKAGLGKESGRRQGDCGKGEEKGEVLEGTDLGKARI